MRQCVLLLVYMCTVVCVLTDVAEVSSNEDRSTEANGIRQSSQEVTTVSNNDDEDDDEIVSPAMNFNGYWYNQHGSELFLEQSAEGHLQGEYRTNVESSNGIAGTTHSPVKGSVSGNIFSFQVTWQGGRSVTTWTGQYHTRCSRQSLFYKPSQSNSVLHTTWLLTTAVESCDDAWKQTRIGQDVFTRRAMREGPRRHKNKHTPQQSRPA